MCDKCVISCVLNLINFPFRLQGKFLNRRLSFLFGVRFRFPRKSKCKAPRKPFSPKIRYTIRNHTWEYVVRTLITIPAMCYLRLCVFWSCHFNSPSFFCIYARLVREYEFPFRGNLQSTQETVPARADF